MTVGELIEKLSKFGKDELLFVEVDGRSDVDLYRSESKYGWRRNIAGKWELDEDPDTYDDAVQMPAVVICNVEDALQNVESIIPKSKLRVVKKAKGKSA